LCSGGQQASGVSSSDDVVVKASGLQKNIDSVSLTANQLTVSFFALLAWMVMVTVALLSVVLLGCRRWRRQRRRAAEWEGDGGCRSISDASSVCSQPSTLQTAAAAVAVAAASRDRTVLEGVEIGRRSSSQASVDDRINSLTTSTAEP